MATATSPVRWPTMHDLLEELGGIDPIRVRLDPPPGTATEAQLIQANARNGKIYELVDGTLVEKGMGYAESVIALLLGGFLNGFVIPRNLGIVSGPDGMMRLYAGTVRGPDLAFASWDRIPGRRFPTEPIAGFAPDLAVEVLSVSNTRAEMDRKRAEYFQAGVRLVWEVDPRARVVAVHESTGESTRIDERGTLDGGAVLPGFALDLADLFAGLDRQD
ncbi:Uma2 family endonuclease [Tundrisphaera sp. TA3]|uniref:Uma2 family endonuclease n=1 Tax=Tundrisphaera sp. TA3 TaxID=3435775 RepID=UPI003EB82006